MSGHNKWSTIKHKKGKADAKRGKEFTRLSKEIIMAAKLGGKDPGANNRLRAAIAAAKSANMPNDTIDRAIRKGAGEVGQDAIEELNYEGYAPGGVAVMVDCLSDNRNRTAADVRHIFTKANGNLANSGAVAWMFHRKARFVVTGDHADEMRLMELCFDAGIDIEEIVIDEGAAEMIAPPEAFDPLLMALEAAGIALAESGINRIPENQVAVTDLGAARQIVRLLEALEDNDDVQEVVSNADFDESVLEQLDED